MEDRVGIIFSLVVLLLLGALIIFLGFLAANFWVSALTFGGCLAVLAGTNRAREEKFIAYIFWSLVGFAMLIGAMWIGDMAGRFWWTPIWLLLGAVLVTTGISLRDEYEDLAAWLSIILGILLMVFSILGPWLLYDAFQGTASSLSVTTPSIAATDFSLNAVLSSTWQFLWMSLKSWWGILYVVIIALLGRYWLGRWGWIILPVLLIITVGLLSWLFPETYSLLVELFSSSPVVWMGVILARSQQNLGSAAWGSMLAGAVLAILLFPVYRETYRANRLIGEVQNLRRIFGTTFAMDRMQSKEMGPLTATASFLTILLVLIFSVSTWMALLRLADQFGPLPFPLLGIPDLAIPHFKPVWMWNYFILPAITGILVIIQNQVNARLRLVQAGGGLVVGTFIIALIVGLFIPAGVFCFSIGQSLLLILLSPLALIGLPEPGRRPVMPPRRPKMDDEPGLEEFLELEIAKIERAREAKQSPEPRVREPVIPELHPKADHKLPREVDKAEGLILTGALLHEHSRPIRGLAFGEDQATYIIDSLDQLWKLQAGRAVEIDRLEISEPDNLIPLPGNRMAVVCRSGQIVIYPLDSAGDLGEISTSSPMLAYAINPFGTILAYTRGDYADADVHALVLAAKKEQILLSDVDDVSALAFSNDSRYLAIGTSIGEVHIFDMASRKAEKLLVGNRLGEASAIAADAKGGWVVTHTSGRCQYWDEDGELAESIQCPGRPTVLRIDGPTRKVAIGIDTGETVVTEPGLDKEILAIKVQRQGLDYVCFEPGGQGLIYVNYQNQVRRFDI